MNLVHYNIETNVVISISYSVADDISLQEGQALTDSDFPKVNCPRGKEVRYYYDKETDSFSYELVDRPLTIEEQLEVTREQLTSIQDAVNMLLGV